MASFTARIRLAPPLDSLLLVPRHLRVSVRHWSKIPTAIVDMFDWSSEIFARDMSASNAFYVKHINMHNSIIIIYTAV